MLEIAYAKVIPYPFQVVLEQYFDLEHIAHVHPTTLGECVVVENTGARIVYDQIWPANWRGRRARSRVLQTYQPPGEIWFEFLAGKHKGTKVHSRLTAHAQGTEVNETYYVPWLPNWGFVRRLIAPLVMRQVERIWDEDLLVGVCIGGWPRVPDQTSRVEDPAWRRPPLKSGSYPVGPVENFPPGSMTLVATPGGPVLLMHGTHGLCATHPICPHTGGPLYLGKLDGACAVCPWHGARFDCASGQAMGGPTRVSLPVYTVHVEAGQVIVTSLA